MAYNNTLEMCLIEELKREYNLNLDSLQKIVILFSLKNLSNKKTGREYLPV